MRDAIKRAVRNVAMLAGVALALPVSCGQLGGNPQTGAIQSSLPDRASPFGPGFTDDEQIPTRDGLPGQ